MSRIIVKGQRAVTPSDTDWYEDVRWLRVRGAGDLALQSLEDDTPVIITVLANEYVPFLGGRVRQTGTTATGITVHQ